MDNYSFTIEWPGPDGSTLVYTVNRPTAESALRAKTELIERLAERYPKKRTVLVQVA